MMKKMMMTKMKKKVRTKMMFTKRTSSTSKTLSVCKSIIKGLREPFLDSVLDKVHHGVDLVLVFNLSQHSLLRR